MSLKQQIEAIIDYGTEPVDQLLSIFSEYAPDPFDFVEPCEQDCSEARHAYYAGQWNMAERMEQWLKVANGGLEEPK